MKVPFGLLTALAVGAVSGGGLSAQEPALGPANSPPSSLPALAPATQPPAGASAGPNTSGAYNALQSIASSPCTEPPPASPAPPSLGGPLMERQKLLGDWGGVRSGLSDHGVTANVFATNIFGNVANGGLQETFQYRGRTDFLFNVNGEKAGLWKGSFIDLHLEMGYGTPISNSTGTLEPTSLAQIVPVPNGYVGALTAVKFTQALSERFVVFAGKINTGDLYNQPFTGGAAGVDGFLNGGLLFPAVLARTTPYSSWGAGFSYLKEGQPIFSFMVLDANNTPTRDGFDTFFDNGVVMLPSINIPTKFFGLPGHQGFSGSYSTKRYTLIDRSSFISAIILNQPLATKAGSWSLAYSFDQALYVDPLNPKRSWGVFGNAGLADQNPSPFRWVTNIGVGGSSLLPGRKLDTFGVGYYALGINKALQNLAPRLLPFRDNEQGVELFYNYAVSPWFRLTPDMQVALPGRKAADWATTFSLRAKIDF